VIQGLGAGELVGHAEVELRGEDPGGHLGHVPGVDEADVTLAGGKGEHPVLVEARPDVSPGEVLHEGVRAKKGVFDAGLRHVELHLPEGEVVHPIHRQGGQEHHVLRTRLDGPIEEGDQRLVGPGIEGRRHQEDPVRPVDRRVVRLGPVVVELHDVELPAEEAAGPLGRARRRPDAGAGREEARHELLSHLARGARDQDLFTHDTER